MYFEWAFQPGVLRAGYMHFSNDGSMHSIRFFKEVCDTPNFKLKVLSSQS